MDNFNKSKIFLILISAATLCGATTIVCRDGRFPCENRGACIPYDYVCDGRNDCSDSSDETNCQNGRQCKIKQCSHFCHQDPRSNHPTCNCPGGFLLLSDGKTCQDINECDNNPALCSQNCTNTPGSFVCSCYEGFIHNQDGSCKSKTGEIVRPKLVCAGGKHPCDNGDSCISVDFVCDNSVDCSDESDEQNCQIGKLCKLKQCDQLCTDETNGYPFRQRFPYNPTTADKVLYGTRCSCQEGYTLNSNNITCDDVDECVSGNHSCTQICKNTIGSYECSCTAGYYFDSLDRVCRAIGTYPLLYLSSKDSIIVHNVALNRTYSAGETLQSTPELSDFSTIESMAYDSSKKRMLYLEMGTLGNRIRSQEDSHVKRNDMLEMKYNFVYALSMDCDWITGNVYVSDAGSGKIVACVLDKKKCSVVVDDDKSRPIKILLNPTSRKMYWINHGENSGIYSAGMDGKNMTRLVPSNRTVHKSIALDRTTQILLYSQTNGNFEEIKAIDLSTMREWTIFSNKTYPVIDAPIQDVAVFEDTIYFSTIGFTSKIWSFPKYSKTTGPKVQLSLQGQRQINAMVIHHPLLTPTDNYENPCLGANCTNICLLAPSEDYFCTAFTEHS